MPRFVILEHRGDTVHWDLMLEAGGVLKTWSLQSPPDQPGPIPAESLPDHRLMYLDYEGPLSRDRGHVRRWDGGTFEVLRQEPDLLEVALEGAQAQGAFQLQRAAERWTFQRAQEA